MSAIFIYAIKSAICLALLYLPYTLLMRRDTFYSFNRIVLMGIVLLALVLPALDLPVFDNGILSGISGKGRAIIEIGMPQAVIEGTGQHVAQPNPVDVSQEWSVLLVQILLLIYIIGVGVCFVWKLISLIRLMRFIPAGSIWKEQKDGVTIYCHLGEASPCSWMNKIVISEDDYNNNPSVMIHEKAHCHKGHSWDTLLVSLVEVFMWFNPCIWMLDHSLQEVHEYEADDEVLRQGVTAKNYQMLLIEKAISTSSYTFANGFNHSLLKKRITMMMKKKSNKWLSGTKALYLLPVALVAVAAFATPKVSKNLEAVIDGKVNVNVLNDQNISSKNVENQAEVAEIAPALPIQDVKEVEEAPTQLVQTEPEVAPDEDVYQDPDTTVFSVVEVMPEFPGGMQALMTFMASNIHYPKIAQEMGVQGRVLVQFVVDKTGKVSQARCVRGVPAPVAPANATDEEKKAYEKKGEGAYEINQEALRVVESMPAWKPGMQKGQPVNVRYTVPVNFKLQ
ncbi:MAG: M56 family metallopeptidase [Bacteroidaceae bacterium]|nr:M56 family metallopeptidase [Bacteroidaceae bacterium]